MDDEAHAYGGGHLLARDRDRHRMVGHAGAVPRRILFGDQRWRDVGYVEAVATDPTASAKASAGG